MSIMFSQGIGKGPIYPNLFHIMYFAISDICLYLYYSLFEFKLGSCEGCDHSVWFVQ